MRDDDFHITGSFRLYVDESMPRARLLPLLVRVQQFLLVAAGAFLLASALLAWRDDVALAVASGTAGFLVGALAIAGPLVAVHLLMRLGRDV